MSPSPTAGAATALLLLLTAACAERVEAVVDDRAEERGGMVSEQIEARGVRDARVLAALRHVPRHEFVPESLAALAYSDQALPIGLGQTISQPYVVAFMSEALELAGNERVLEIGTGSGYQAAILAELCAEVYSIEIVPELAERAASVLAPMDYEHLHLRTGDGYAGWPEAAPFDAILLTAAPDHVPQPLLDQLRVGGVLLLPLGGRFQEIVRIEKTPDGLERRALLPVTFVPMTGEAERR